MSKEKKGKVWTEKHLWGFLIHNRGVMEICEVAVHKAGPSQKIINKVKQVPKQFVFQAIVFLCNKWSHLKFLIKNNYNASNRSPGSLVNPLMLSTQ